MRNLLIKVNDKKDLKYPAFGYILGINNFSIGFGINYDVNKIKEIKEKFIDKKIFVSLNKPIFNNELDMYKSILLKLDKLGLDGIIIGDIAALTYNLNTNIILDQMHLNNSYYTINHYFNNNVGGIMLTNDITKKEINEIKKNTSALLFKKVFGYTHLSSSNRKLISNYKEHFNKNDSSNSYLICEKNHNNYYKIYEDNFGTHILSDKPINLLNELDDLNVDYIIIDSFFINENISDVINAYLNNDKSKYCEINKKYNSNDGFINEETIYKVKKDEK